MISSPPLDLLVRIQNGYRASLKSIVAPGSKFTQAICDLLQKYGYLDSVKSEKDGAKNQLVLKLKYDNRQPALTGIKIYSRPGRRIYHRADALPWGKSTSSLIIVSTSKGLLSQKEAQKQNIGGEVIAEVY